MKNAVDLQVLICGGSSQGAVNEAAIRIGAVSRTLTYRDKSLKKTYASLEETNFGLVTVYEIAKELGLALNTVRRWASRSRPEWGDFPQAVRRDSRGRKLYSYYAVLAWRDDHPDRRKESRKQKCSQ